MKNRLGLLVLAVVLAFCAGGLAGYRKQQLALATRKAAAIQQQRDEWEKLKRALGTQIKAFEGQAGVVIEDLDTGWRIVHQPKKKFAAASIIKVPMMAACYQAAREGRLNLSDTIKLRNSDKVSGSGILKQMQPGTELSVSKLIDWMITQSDNTATNILMNRLGKDYFNQYFRRVGLNQTTLVRPMMDFSQRKEGIDNFTTAEDTAQAFRNIYHAQWLDPQASQACMDMLKRQKLKDRLPANLPEGTPVAHKTGLERGVCHDAGIIYTPNGNLLICVLTRRPHQEGVGSQPAKRFIARLAEIAYQYKEGRASL